jgi:hypothetical protein
MEDIMQISQMTSSGMHSKVSAASWHMLYGLVAKYFLSFPIFPSISWLGFETTGLSIAFHFPPR